MDPNDCMIKGFQTDVFQVRLKKGNSRMEQFFHIPQLLYKEVITAWLGQSVYFEQCKQPTASIHISHGFNSPASLEHRYVKGETDPPPAVSVGEM